MSDTPDPIAKEATTLLSTAAVEAKSLIDAAEKTAALLMEKSTERSVHIASEALRKVFGENEDAKRFVDVTKIPLICKSIVQLNEDIGDLKKNVGKIKEAMDVKVIDDVDRHAKQDLIFKIIAWSAGIIAVSLVSTLIPTVLDGVLHLLTKK